MHTHEHAYALTYTTYIIHSYTIQISGPIGLFSNKWANGTTYFGLYIFFRTSVGNVLIVWVSKKNI